MLNLVRNTHIPFGVIAAVKRNMIVDYSISVFTMIGVSAPSFWVGTILAFYFTIPLYVACTI